MSNIITVKNPRGNQIHFAEDKHEYYDERERRYHSVTRVIHSLFPEFPEDMMAYVVARKRVMKENGYKDKSEAPVPECMKRKREVLYEWKQKRDEANDLGHCVHRYAECLLKEIPFDLTFTTQKQEKMCKVLDKFIPVLLEQYEFVESEKIIFCPSILLAGTVDVIMRNRQTKQLCVFDWKTNKSINTKDSYHKKGLLFLDHLDNCNYFHYSLQLNLYKWMLHSEKYGNFAQAELSLFHINTRNVKGYKIYPMNYEIKSMIKYTKNLKEVA